MSGKAVRETLAALGVVASLVFVGVEIRQNTAVARGQTRQELFAHSQEWLTLLTADEAFSELFDAAWNDERLAELPAPEQRRARLMMRMNIMRLENVYLQYAEHLVDQSALADYGFTAGNMFGTATFEAWWRGGGGRGTFDPGFVAYFEERFGLTPS